MSVQKGEVSNDIIYEKFLDVSDAVDNMCKLKNILKSEMSLQHQIMEASVMLGFSFDAYCGDTVDDNFDTISVSDNELLKTYFENQCLGAETNVLTKILKDKNRDYEEIVSENKKVNEIVKEDLIDLRRKSQSTSQQLLEDVIAGIHI